MDEPGYLFEPIIKMLRDEFGADLLGRASGER